MAEYLILHHNKLSGRIQSGWQTRQLFYLDLSNNELSGRLPNDWDMHMVRLRTLYLDHNKLTGEVPENFAWLGSGRLKQLFINDNYFIGEFPEKNWPIGLLSKLCLVNISLLCLFCIHSRCS